MQESINNSTTAKKSNHGSITSYVIGFVLSLILTIIPYCLVTRQAMSGTSLLLAILAFAVAQMLVQVFFFLHLGRGPKPLYNVIFFSATAGFIVMIVGASLLIMGNLYRNMSPQEITTRVAQEENIAEVSGKPTGACQGNNENHVVVLNGDEISPAYIEAERCDTLTFSVEDGADRMIMFGSFNNPMSYGGVYDMTVGGDRSETITLNQIGTFSFHDHSRPEIVGTFSVVQP